MNPEIGCFKKIIEEYFELVDSYFKSIKQYLGDDDESHIELGEQIARYPLISELILDAVDDIKQAILDFWEKNQTNVRNFIISQEGLKCLYSGDISPYSLERFIKRTSLYVDTIIIPDPLYVMTMFASANRKWYLNKLLRHVFNVWRLKDLILADSEKTILILYPVDLRTISNADDLIFGAKQQHVEYISKLFEKDLKTEEETTQYLTSFQTQSDFFDNLKYPKLLPNKFNTPEKFVHFANEMIQAGKKSANLRMQTVGDIFYQYTRGQFIRVTEHKFYCSEFNAEPIYDNESAWFFMNYVLGGTDIDTAIINALQREQFEWIGNAPLEVIKILREEGELEYMRQTLRQGIFSLSTKRDDDLSKTISVLENNLKIAFDKQKKDINNIQIKAKQIYKKDVPIAVISFLLGFIPVIGNFLSIPFSAKDIWGKYKERTKLMETNPKLISLLIKSYEKNEE